MNIFCGLRLPRKERQKLLKEFGENSEETSGQNSGQKFETFGELWFCNFCNLHFWWITSRGQKLTSTYIGYNLWFAKPMVCVRVAFHENDANYENDENDEDNSDSYKQGVECWIRGNHGNRENDKNHANPGCKPRVPQTTGLEIPEYKNNLRGFHKAVTWPGYARDRLQRNFLELFLPSKHSKAREKRTSPKDPSVLKILWRSNP